MLLDVFKDGELVETIELSASKRLYKVGRQAGMADIVLVHGSISREQATLTVSASGSVVVADLGSAHGTKISGKPLQPNKPHLLPPGRSLTFGQSTRVFKLREGGTGFVGGTGVPLPTKAAAALDDPRVQAALHVLRHGAADCERLRPDGFLRLTSLLSTQAVASTGCTDAELASLPVRVADAIEAVASTEGEVLLRATSGHAEEVRVDTSLSLAPYAGALPELLVFCSSFKEWNAVRSHGVGAGRSPPQPIRLSTAPPRASFKVPSLGRTADLHVYIRTASLLAEGHQIFAVAGEGVAADAAEALVCTGDSHQGTVGPWHFENVLNARDGSEMMSASEVAPLREQRTRELAAKQATAAAAAATEEARRLKQVRRREEATAAAEVEQPPPKRHNPYLAHMQEEDDED